MKKNNEDSGNTQNWQTIQQDIFELMEEIRTLSFCVANKSESLDQRETRLDELTVETTSLQDLKLTVEEKSKALSNKMDQIKSQF